VNRSDIIHRAATVVIQTMSHEELVTCVYKKSVYELAVLSEEDLVDTIKEYFPSVVQFIKEDEEDG
jgi:hypothetical protein